VLPPQTQKYSLNLSKIPMLIERPVRTGFLLGLGFMAAWILGEMAAAFLDGFLGRLIEKLAS